jgi:hypothetical protein
MGLPIQSAPTYTCVLPSDGTEVKFRPFLVKEQKVLILARESEDTVQSLSAVKDLIHAVTYEKVNADELAMIDLEYLFLKVRSVSIGETIELSLTCRDQECNGSEKVRINLDEIEASGEQPTTNTVMINDTVGIEVRTPLVKDIKLTNQNQADADVGLDVVKNSITSIFDEEQVYDKSDMSKSDLDDFIDSLTYKQLELLGDWFDDLPKLSHTAEWKCNVCERENKRVLEGINSFF